jgi:hypothetical protein
MNPLLSALRPSSLILEALSTESPHPRTGFGLLNEVRADKSVNDKVLIKGVEIAPWKRQSKARPFGFDFFSSSFAKLLTGVIERLKDDEALRANFYLKRQRQKE